MQDETFTTSSPLLSVIIPCLDEQDSVELLADKLAAELTPMTGSPDRYELVFVDDGSTDDTPRVLARLADERSYVRVVTFRRNFGKSAALDAGFEASRAPLLVTIDGDLQDDPAEIRRLLSELKDGYDVVSGWKQDRKDPWSKRVPSWVFNKTLSLISGIQLHDYNCGLKAYRREAVEELDVYGELHRYIPVLMHHRGFRVGEIPVQHHPRRFGESKYGLERFTRGFLDLLTVILLTRYATRPLHAFGGVGLILGAAGFGLLSYLSALKFAYGEALSNRPLLLLGILLMLVGLQSISTGLIGEMIARSDQRDQTQYVLADLDSASNRALASLDLEAPAREADIHELPVEQPSSDINPDIEKAANHT